MMIIQNLWKLDGYVNYAIKNGIDTISQFITNYLFITYMVTSNPKRISVAAGVVHMVYSPFFRFICELYAYVNFSVTVKSLTRGM